MDKWDKRFLRLARTISSWSKDESTQVGAVIVRPDKTIASVGFNGFPKTMPDKEELYKNRDEKYSRIIHAEMNAALFSHDESLNGYTLYTYPMMSCERCFVHMVQLGITRFVYPEAEQRHLIRWSESFERVKQYAKECNVTLVSYSKDEFVDIKDQIIEAALKFRNGLELHESGLHELLEKYINEIE